MARRLARTAAVAALAALALGGCGNKHHEVTEAPTEGIWVDVGELDYHVQGSRQLTPAQVPDRDYLKGLPDGILPPSGRETWFAVWLRVENRTDEPHETARDIEIVDTEQRVYEPLELDPAANPFAYRSVALAPETRLPHPESSAGLSATGGAMLLYKLPLQAFQNRPLELRITADGVEPHEAIVDLDV